MLNLCIDAYALGYPGGVRPIILDDVRCTGDELRLTDCPANEIGDHDCNHFEHAAVVCIEPQRVSSKLSAIIVYEAV